MLYENPRHLSCRQGIRSGSLVGIVTAHRWPSAWGWLGCLFHREQFYFFQEMLQDKNSILDGD